METYTEITQQRSGCRDVTLDIAKGIAMILVVVGHSCCPLIINQFIYWFHVPLFFFVSGWLFKQKYIVNPKALLISRLKGLYIPMIKWSAIFILMHNVFLEIHFNSSWISPYEMAEEFFKAITLRYSDEPLLGPYWFLISLIFCTFYSFIWIKAANVINTSSRLWIYGGILFFLISAAAIDYLPIKIPVLWGKAAFQATAFFLTGYVISNTLMDKRFIFNRYQMLLFMIPAVLAGFMPTHEIALNGGIQCIYFYFIAICGIIATLSLSKLLSRTRAAGFLSYIGARTFYILTFQIVFLKIVFAVYIESEGLSIDMLPGFEYQHFNDSLLWIPATVAGVAGPLALYRLFHLKILNIKGYFQKHH